LPDIACTKDDDCSADSFCGGSRCVAWTALPVERQFSTSCRDKVDLPSLFPEVQCTWPPAGQAVAVAPNSVQVIGTPMVVDFDFDKTPSVVHPSIVFISYEGAYNAGQGVIRVIDGKDCHLQASITGEFPFSPEVSVALGDVDGDGRPDIVAADEDRSGVAPVSGIEVWKVQGSGTDFVELARRRQLGSTSLIKGLALHDLDDNGLPEILTEDSILTYDPDAKAILELVGLRSHYPNGADSVPGVEPPAVTDIDGDHTAELVTTQGVFDWNPMRADVVDKTDRGGSPIWATAASVPSTFVAMGDLGSFSTALPGGVDSVELVVVGFGGELWVKQIDGQVRHHVDKSGFAGGPPVIADFDGDGKMEFASPGFDQLTVFDLDCASNTTTGDKCANGHGKPNPNAIMWQSDTQGARSGMAVFDFDGDGRAEVVYADQCFMRVYDGLTGDVLFSVPRSSTTSYEYPVVADTDGDGYSEIVTTSNDNDVTLSCPATDPMNQKATVAFQKTHGVTVWKETESANAHWAGSRPVWNQHAYFVTNVKDDGTIPRMSEFQNNWAKGMPNTYRQNVQGKTGIPLSRGDITTTGAPNFSCVLGKARIKVSICNRGLQTLPADKVTAALIETGKPSNQLCTMQATADLAEGACADLSCDIPVPPNSQTINVTIFGDPTDAIEECNEANNQSTISGISCLAPTQ